MKSIGFTLIELLVVIGIICILASIGMSMLTSSRDAAYDVTAKKDLKEFISAQQNHYNDHQKFVGNLGESIRNDGLPSDFSLNGLNISREVVITVISGNPLDPYNPIDPFIAESKHKNSAKTYIFNVMTNEITEN